MECLFCRIIEGSIPSNTIYEDELVKVFLDINPNTNGHCLIIPKEHVVIIDDLNNQLMTHILKVIKEMHQLLKEKLNIEGMTIVQNNNLGQEVKHLHFHLIPRYSDDKWSLSFNQDILQEPKEIINIIKND